MRPIYSLLFLALLPFIVLRLYLKGRTLPAYRQRISERFARYVIRPPVTSPLWIHAVSVGECEASFPLVREFQRQYPEIPVLMTCTTPTGSSRIQSVLGDSVLHVYLPYDLPWIARRFLNFFKPRLGIIMETEIWPNLFCSAGKLGIPLMIANGRLSEASMRGYSKLSSLIKPSLDAVKRIAAQSDVDAARYLQVGARPSTVLNTGNIKYDITWSSEQAALSLALRTERFGQRKVIVAGSTHPGEEALVLDAFRTVRETFEDAILILVPRHPERGRSVFDLAKDRGFAAKLLSNPEPSTDQVAVLVIDRVGELRCYYGASDVAYIGGSLVPHGGQNPLEPLVAGIPVVFGPHMKNFKDIRAHILEAHAGREIDAAESLAREVTRLLENPSDAREMGQRGARMILSNQGALQRIFKIATDLLLQPH